MAGWQESTGFHLAQLGWSLDKHTPMFLVPGLLHHPGCPYMWSLGVQGGSCKLLSCPLSPTTIRHKPSS